MSSSVSIMHVGKLEFYSVPQKSWTSVREKRESQPSDRNRRPWQGVEGEAGAIPVALLSESMVQVEQHHQESFHPDCPRDVPGVLAVLTAPFLLLNFKSVGSSQILHSKQSTCTEPDT